MLKSFTRPVTSMARQEAFGYIYGLPDPRTAEIRYVGKTIELRRRHKEHIESNEDTPKGKWIQELRSQQLVPGIVILEKCLESRMSEREAWWIDFWDKRNPGRLTNTVRPRMSFGKLRNRTTEKKNLMWQAVRVTGLCILILYFIGSVYLYSMC